MDRIELNAAEYLKGEFTPTPDKSISHRAILFASLAQGQSRIRNFLRAQDPMSTLQACRALGVEIDDRGEDIIVTGKGINALTEPSDVIDCGNSGTTIRLLSGILSGNPFLSVLTGDSSLRNRPMARIIEPLRLMGADLHARAGDRYPPIAIRGGALRSISYVLPVASAQVKSAIILAGLYAQGETEVIEPEQSRDHTERMLPAFGVEIVVDGLRIAVQGGQNLKGTDILVPGDFSSAAFFIVGALLMRKADLTIRGVGVNPTRTGLLRILREMGAEIELSDAREVSGELVADIHCRGGAVMRAVTVQGEAIPALIDEFPILCVAATQAHGTTTVRGAAELRVKESDRIKTVTTELRKMGAIIEELEDGVSIEGRTPLRGASVDSHGDHRIAMALAIAGLIAAGTTTIHGVASVNVSFPGFFQLLRKLTV